MAFAVTHVVDPVTGRHVVTAKVVLSLAETNELFLSGDTIVSWPEGELMQSRGLSDSATPGASESALVRTGMFVSELAQLPLGLKIGYRQGAEAARAAQLIRLQLLKAGVEEGM